MYKQKAQSRLWKTRKLKRIKVEAIILGYLLLIYLGMKIAANIAVFNPAQALATGEREIQVVEKVVIKEQPRENIDTWIGDSIDQFLPTHKSEARMIMHCLAHRESGHGSSKAQGDGGLAGGGFQFHEATWIRMRNQMIKEGLIADIGSRFDLKQATYTTAWAISKGRALEWGPILRDSKGSEFASCQTPSWYNKE